MQGIGIVFGCDAARFIAKHSGCKKERLKINSKIRACLNFAQPYFEGCFRGYFSVVVRSVAGYVTNNNRKRDRKEAQKGLNKKL